MTDPVSRAEASETLIGVRRPRPDSSPKVQGITRYAADEPDPPGLLHARPVLSPYAHARIRAVHAEDALRLPGVVAVLTSGDLPIKGAADMRMYQPLAASEAVFAGQPVAVVIAESPEAARDGVDAVVLDAEPLPVVMDVETAMDPGSTVVRPRVTDEDAESAKSIHASVTTAEASELDAMPLSANVIGRHQYRRGDIDAALEASDVRISRRFQTGWVYQAYLETHAATAIPDGEGGMDIRASTQGTFFARDKLADIFGLPPSKVRVTGTPLGGAFGSKLLVVEPIAMGSALHLGRPVRMEFTRAEDIAATNPASASVLEVEVGARSDGTLTGLRARLTFDAGAWSEWTIEFIGAVLLPGPYRWEAIDIAAFGVETNRVGTGSYRGPGGPQASFAIETLMDELAARIDLDPLELRRRNLVAAGDPMADDEPWAPTGVAEVVDRLAEHPLWQKRDSLPPNEGVGVAVGIWTGAKNAASAVCRMEPDGTVTVITGVVDMSGTTAGLAAIAADTLGVGYDQVAMSFADTGSAPRTPISGGSVITYGVGRAIVKAAQDLRRRILELAADELEIEPTDLEIVDGVVRPRGVPDRGINVTDLVSRHDGLGRGDVPLEGHGPVGTPALAPSTSGHLAHVRVDPETGAVDVLGYLVVQDVGRAINPALVEGQMRGGATQALGWALLEEMQFDEAGQLLTGTFMDYPVPRAAFVPPIETSIVESPAPDGPYGARGVGEASVCGGASAVANAIAAAAGVRMTRLPMTPPRIRDAVRAATADRTAA
jgi:CO/xanthine dehydrogenase Mo-binding subunit